jgi:hypothetical protein
MLHFAASSGQQVHVLVAAASSAPSRPARVLRPDGLVHGVASPSFGASASGAVDVLVTDASGEAEAFNILDVAVAAQDLARTTLSLAAPHEVVLVWVRGGTDGSYTPFDTGVTYLHGDVLDDDGYDDAVIAHELGHQIELWYGRTSNPGGVHYIYAPEDPTLAWSEGFASWFGSAVRANPIYVDTGLEQTLTFDIATDVTKAGAALPMTQNVSENMVSEVLWNLGAAGTLATEHQWLRSLPADRGVTGVDLVDFLDGFLVVEGNGKCTQVMGALSPHLFPYDYAGPTTCP